MQLIIRGLYDDMIKPPNLGGLDESKDNYGNFIISDSKLCGFFPPQVQLIPNQRSDLCGGENFVLLILIQTYLYAWRFRRIICIAITSY